MGIFSFFGRFIRGLWAISRASWVSITPELRPRSPASALYLFLFLVIAIIGLILMALGIDLDTADRWIDAQGGWLDAIGTALFRIVCGLVLLCCVGLVQGGLWQAVFQRGKGSKDDRIACLAIGVAAVIGYFAWFGMMP